MRRCQLQQHAEKGTVNTFLLLHRKLILNISPAILTLLLCALEIESRVALSPREVFNTHTVALNVHIIQNLGFHEKHHPFLL